MGFGSAIGSAVGGIVGSVAGGIQEGAGLTSTPYEYDASAFKDPNSEANKQRLEEARRQVQNREAPTMVASRLGPAAQADAPGSVTAGSAAAGTAQSGQIGEAPIVGAPQNVSAQNVAAGVAQAGRADQAPQAEFRTGQQALTQTLTDRIAGNAPSVAEQQLRRTTDRNIQQIAGTAATGGAGVNPALSRRLAMNAIARANQDAAGQAAGLRAGEQAQAEQTLGSVLQGARGQDVTLAGQQAELDTRVALANLNADQQAQVANQAAALQAQGMNQDVALRTALANAGFLQERSVTQAQLDTQTALANLDAGTRTAIQNAANDLQAQGMNQEAALRTALANAGFLQESTIRQGELSQQAGAANQQAQLENQRQIDALTQYYTQAGLDQDRAQFLARMELEKLRGGAYQDSQNQNLQTGGAITGGLFNAAGGALAALSDKRAKKNIGPGEEAVRKVLDRLSESEPMEMEPDSDDMHRVRKVMDKMKPYTFEYEDPDSPGATHGEIVGIMAQDMEKSPAGREMVRETPHGKMIDVAKALAASLAANADLHQRVKKLERKSA